MDFKVTPSQLAEMLLQNPSLELQPNQKLILQHINTHDFVSAISAPDHSKRLLSFYSMMKKLDLDITLEGSIFLGEFNLSDHSWTLSAGESGFLKISAKPSTLIKTVSEIVAFLSLMPAGNAFPLKARQDLLLTGLSSDAMLAYYRLCQETTDLQTKEKGQDNLFHKACELLPLKNLHLRIYGLNASQVDRNIDLQAGGILFKGLPKDANVSHHLMLTLLKID